MSQKYEKLKTLLKELFQLDQPDLDFGLYRIMHAKSGEYSEGDFLSRRVYKPGVYAIPYEGEEVTLHWANKDQYYIKTSEYLRDYAFRLRPDDDKQPIRVHFRLADAAEGEHGNVKAAEGKDRVFILAAGGESGRDFVAEEDGEQGPELSLRFEYRPATLTDWPEDVRDGKSKPPAQKNLSALAARRVLAVTEAALAPWIMELGKPHVVASGEKADYTRIEARLRRYTARNTFDYLIHKDLGGFLRRELDFYIKNEVMHLDDVENETAQREEWVKLFAIDEIQGDLMKPGYSKPLTAAFLTGHPTLVVDTRNFDAGFTARLLEAVGDIDAQTDGVLFHSENFQGLSLMQSRYREQTSCAFNDPPYNTGVDGFPYEDAYEHAS